MLTLTWKGDHYIAELHGIVTIRDTQSLYEKLVSTDLIEYIDYGIVDCRNAVKIQYEEEDYIKQAVFAKTASTIHRRDYKVGIVVSSEEIAEAVKKFFKTVRENTPTSGKENYSSIWTKLSMG